MVVFVTKQVHRQRCGLLEAASVKNVSELRHNSSPKTSDVVALML
jgi:hypothetical protein